MNPQNRRRAVALVDDLVILAVVCGLGFGLVQARKLFAPAKPKAEIQQTDAAVAAAQKAAEDARRAAAELSQKLDAATKAQAEKDAAEKARQQSAAGFVAGAQLALIADPAPTIQSRVAKTMVDDAAKTLDPATAAQLREMTALVRDLIAANATTSAELSAKEAEAAQARAAAEQAKAAAAAAGQQLQAKTAEVESLTTLTQTQATAARGLSQKIVEWSQDSVTGWGRFRAALWLCALLAAAAIGISIKLRGVARTKDDLVALGEHTKAEVLKLAGPEIHAAVEKSQEAWKQGDIRLDAAIAAAKAKLRL